MDATGYMVGSGTNTSASGDQLFWDCSGHLNPPDFVLAITGGTGRFEGATGELITWEITNLVQTVVGGTMTITCEANATGWISY